MKIKTFFYKKYFLIKDFWFLKEKEKEKEKEKKRKKHLMGVNFFQHTQKNVLDDIFKKMGKNDFFFSKNEKSSQNLKNLFKIWKIFSKYEKLYL